MSLYCTNSEILSLISQNLKRSRDSQHIPFGSNVLRMHSYSSVSISTRNLMCLVSPVTKIWLGAVYRRRLGFDTVYLHAHFDGFNFSRSTSVASKFKMGRVTLTTLHLRVICHPYAGT